MIKRRSVPVGDSESESRSRNRDKKKTSSKLDDSQEDVIIQPFSKVEARLLVARGVPYADLPSGQKQSVSDMLLKIQTEREGQPEKLISTTKQLKVLNAIMANPLRGSYTLCISSRPSDLKAKQLAATIMMAALNSPKAKSHSKPLWHRVYGSLGDPLRDKTITEIPSLLVISNLVDGSSPNKIEKVRDLLEKFSHIPRIVIYGGGDPMSLFSEKLHYPLKAGIFLGTKKKVQYI